MSGSDLVFECDCCGHQFTDGEQVDVCDVCEQDFGDCDGSCGNPDCGNQHCQHCGNNTYAQCCPNCREALPIEQCTGLKDSEGALIYENDIVRGSYGIPPVVVTAKVEWSEGQFGIETKGHNPEWASISDAIEYLNIHVIGNVHENPELLEVQ